MKTFSRLVCSLLVGAVVYGIFSWPLFPHFDEAIPYSSRRMEEKPVRHMVMGDHLQLLYHFWLPAEWLSGNTRFGYDLYQFNTGGDDERAFPKTDYFPFSALFALLHFFLSSAASWNLVSLLAFGFALFFMWQLLLVYKLNTWPAFTLALAMVSTPYQWANFFGGSPTGFAMMTVPMLFFGIEEAVRKGSWKGGLLSALALVSAFWTDTHVLLFSYLLGPLWVLLVVLHDGGFPWKSMKGFMQRVVALLPLLLMALLTMGLRLRTKSAFQSDSVIGGGWTWRDISNFSPGRAGLVAWQSTRQDHHIYLGVLVLIMLVAAFLIGVTGFIRRKQVRHLLHYGLLGAGLVLMISFTLGTNGPLEGRVMYLARKLIPPMAMMRQPAKMMAMVAPVLALLLLPLWQLITVRLSKPALRILVPGLLSFLILLDWRLQIFPGISTVNTHQGAYAAVAADAEEPRALVLPIWAGESAWASLYQHNAAQHRLRMINGYSPVVSQNYVEEVFVPLISTNAGVLTDEQLDLLDSMDVTHILLHQDAFPERVSWFPVGMTLRKLLEHPRLDFLEQDQSVWAFRIRSEPKSEPGSAPETWKRFGSRINADFTFERLPEGAEIVQDSNAGFGRAVRFTIPGQSITLRPLDSHEMPDPRLMLRARGQARWRFVLDRCGEESEVEFELDSESWTWTELPLSWLEDCDSWQPGFHLEEGEMDIDLVTYFSGPPLELEPGESHLFPAATFFHSGYTDTERDVVIFRPTHESAQRILYGPRLLLPPGTYRAEIVWAEEPPAGEHLGQLELRLDHDRIEAAADIIGGEPGILEFSTRERDLPLEFGFIYSRNAPLALRGIRVTRED